MSQKTLTEIKKTLTEIKPLLKEYYVTELGIFGSYAKGHPSKNSDIDILIDFEGPLGLNFLKLKYLLEESLSQKIDLVTKNSLHKALKEEILSSTLYV